MREHRLCAFSKLADDTLHQDVGDHWRIAVEDDRVQPTMTIAEAIEAVRDTEHTPVTFESCDHVTGPFFHGTRVACVPGDEIVPGHGSNYHDGRVSNHVYLSAVLEPAAVRIDN